MTLSKLAGIRYCGVFRYMPLLSHQPATAFLRHEQWFNQQTFMLEISQIYQCRYYGQTRGKDTKPNTGPKDRRQDGGRWTRLCMLTAGGFAILFGVSGLWSITKDALVFAQASFCFMYDQGHPTDLFRKTSVPWEVQLASRISEQIKLKYL